MRNRFLTLSAVATLVPTLAMAQQRPAQPTTPPANQPRPATTPAQQPAARPAQQPAARPATPPPAQPARPAMAMRGPDRSSAWEITVQGGLFSVDKAFASAIGGTASPSQFLFGGRAAVAKHLNSSWDVGVGAGFGGGSNSLTTLRPTADLTWTSDINKDFGFFVPIGIGLNQLSGANSNKATSDFGVHAGLGIRKFLSEGTALRIEGRMSYDHYAAGNPATSGYNGEGLIGLSFFPSSAPAVVTSVTVTPSGVTLTSAGQTQALTATAKDARGRPMAGKMFSWRSSNPAVATVSAAGTVTAVGNGAATISATSDAVSGSVPVTVARATTAVAVAPTTASLNALGATQQLTATASDASRAAIQGAPVTWTSSNAAVATVSATGLVTAVSNGTAQITANSGGRTAMTSVTVAQATASVAVSPATAALTSAGGTQQYMAQAMDANNRPVAGRTFTWASESPAVATISPAGMATAVANGTARITAMADGRTGSATLTVTLPPPGAPTPAGIPAMGQSVVLRAVTFTAASARLTRASNAVLDGIATSLQNVLRSAPNAKFEVGGYTDDRGVPARNRTLSQNRANAVMAYLVSKGVPASALAARGYGPDSPKVPNTTPANRAQNRRVELKRTN